MSVTNFGDRLSRAVHAKGNCVCVGLDPRLEQLPPSMRVELGASFEAQAQAYEMFCKEVIDVVAELVPVVKPQSAFFEELGPHGVMALGQVCQYATSRGLLVIMDAKRNDIGTTATAYAKAYLTKSNASPFACDALTVSPYLGSDSLKPFIDQCHQSGTGIFVLVKTSNPGSGFLQDVVSDSISISERVAEYVQAQSLSLASASDKLGPIGAVVGATYPEQLMQMRSKMPNAWILVPGYGAQGGSASDVACAMNEEGLGAIINSSRGIIFAHENPKYSGCASWQAAVEQSTREMILAIKDARKN